MLSESYEQNLKEGFCDAVIDEITHFQVEHGGGKVHTAFAVPPSSEEYFNYFLIEDLDESVGYDKLEDLVDKLLSEFSPGDFLGAIINGATPQNVKFNIVRGFFSLKEALEYKDTVGIRHIIFCRTNPDKFRISEHGDILYFNEEKH